MDRKLCALFGVPGECLPEIRPTVGSFGEIEGVPVTASMVDSRRALRHGCRRGRPRDQLRYRGLRAGVTGEALCGCRNEACCDGCVADRSQAQLCRRWRRLYAGFGMDWALRLGLAPDLAALDAFDRPPAIERSLAFVPALSGLACPHWDRSAAGFGSVWAGNRCSRSIASTAGGIALRTAEVIEAMSAAMPIGSPFSVDADWSERHFLRFLAPVLAVPWWSAIWTSWTAFGCAGLAPPSTAIR